MRGSAAACGSAGRAGGGGTGGWGAGGLVLIPRKRPVPQGALGAVGRGAVDVQVLRYMSMRAVVPGMCGGGGRGGPDQGRRQGREAQGGAAGRGAQQGRQEVPSDQKERPDREGAVRGHRCASVLGEAGS